MLWLKLLNSALTRIFYALFSLYKWVASPLIHTLAGPGFGCRFQPVCSEYSRDAIRAFGFPRGILLTIRRISRCHPFGGSGYDPIPVISAITTTKDRSLNEAGCSGSQTVEQRK